MSKIENDKLRKVRNEHFIQAFEYVARILGLGQGDLAEAIGSKSAYISNFRKGLRPVPEDTIERLIRVSAKKPGLQIFSEYLYGNSEIMLLSNVSDEEMFASKMRHDNPDYDKIEKEKADSNTLDTSSLINAALAAKDELISAKQKIIDQLNHRLEEKDELITELRSRIADLQRLSSLTTPSDPLRKYPFEIGVAESDERPRL